MSRWRLGPIIFSPGVTYRYSIHVGEARLWVLAQQPGGVLFTHLPLLLAIQTEAEPDED